MEYRTAGGESMVVALVHGYVREGVEAWQYTQDHLGIFFEHALAQGPAADGAEPDWFAGKPG